MNMYHELIITGFGGQGVVLAGKLIASAALMEEREVIWSPSYGPEMRGGPVSCTAIISSRRIGSPEVSQADSLLVMDQASVAKFASRLKPAGLLVVNSSLVRELPEHPGEMLLLPATEAADALGNQRVANVVMLGAFLARRPIVSPESLAEIMRREAEAIGMERLLPINLEALKRGAEMAEEQIEKAARDGEPRVYEYTALAADGNVITGTTEAKSECDLVRRLREKGYFVQKIGKVKELSEEDRAEPIRKIIEVILEQAVKEQATAIRVELREASLITEAPEAPRATVFVLYLRDIWHEVMSVPKYVWKPLRERFSEMVSGAGEVRFQAEGAEHVARVTIGPEEIRIELASSADPKEMPSMIRLVAQVP
jgi:2-oxoglutarate ferredoxin oxidoreductase subunit gamma